MLKSNKGLVICAISIILLAMPPATLAGEYGHWPDRTVADADGHWRWSILIKGANLDPKFKIVESPNCENIEVDIKPPPPDEGGTFMVYVTGYLEQGADGGSFTFTYDPPGVMETGTVIITSAFNVTAYRLILLDRTGSMHANRRSTGNSRFVDAKAMAKSDIRGFAGTDAIGFMYFDSDTIVFIQDGFLQDTTYIFYAMDEIPRKGAWTNLADALCAGADLLSNLSGTKTLYTYTDGYENSSDGSATDICDACDFHVGGAWYYDCDPTDQVTHPCSDWQNCIAASVTAAAVTTVHYFGAPITKAVSIDYASMSEETIKGTPDMNFLKFIAEKSGGMFNFIPDDATAPVMNGDVNCDGVVNMMDVLYLISFLYKGGLTPCGF
jgi:hypothetical protein